MHTWNQRRGSGTADACAAPEDHGTCLAATGEQERGTGRDRVRHVVSDDDVDIPVVGRAERLWDGVEDLGQRFDIERR
jgi:hypothetical protein